MTITATKPMITFNDKARARRKDKDTSQAAADKSQRNLIDAKLLVLLVLKSNPDRTGSEINDLFQFEAARRSIRPRRKGQVLFHWDSPRKRAGELEEDGYLEIVGTRQGESLYRLSPKGIQVVTLGGLPR